ncbi:hypothetical protein DMUE_5496, partial [Dictyocoela muelleri]
MFFILNILAFKIKSKSSNNYIHFSRKDVDEFSTVKLNNSDKPQIGLSVFPDLTVSVRNKEVILGKPEPFQIIKDITGYYRIKHTSGCWDSRDSRVYINECNREDSQLFIIEGKCLHCDKVFNELPESKIPEKSLLDVLSSKLPVNRKTVDKYRKMNGLPEIFNVEDEESEPDYKNKIPTSKPIGKGDVQNRLPESSNVVTPSDKLQTTPEINPNVAEESLPDNDQTQPSQMSAEEIPPTELTPEQIPKQIPEQIPEQIPPTEATAEELPPNEEKVPDEANITEPLPNNNENEIPSVKNIPEDKKMNEEKPGDTKIVIPLFNYGLPLYRPLVLDISPGKDDILSPEMKIGVGDDLGESIPIEKEKLPLSKSFSLELDQDGPKIKPIKSMNKSKDHKGVDNKPDESNENLKIPDNSSEKMDEDEQKEKGNPEKILNKL